jgi:hypothetical protein
MFWHKNTAEKMGLQLSRQLRDAILDVCSSLPSVEGVESERVSIESVILMFVGCRLALQAMSTTDARKTRMREICTVFDSHCFEFLPDGPEFDGLLDKRGEQYFQLFKSHSEQIRSDGKWDTFMQDLAYRFEQFCKGGGNDGDPLISIGGFFGMVPLMFLAPTCWSESFVKTVEYINNVCK